jgi:hypothetical protein
MESRVKKKLGDRALTEEDIPALRDEWFHTFADIFSRPLALPPLRPVNHKIVLIDPSKFYNYYYPKCAESLKVELLEKISRYVSAGWWMEASVDQAAPMLCIPKKDGRLRTVIDCRKRNANTVRDVTPLPDQDQIRTDVARGKYRSKIDISDAFEQMRVEPEDVPKTAFSTIIGTYQSRILQQGDCNGPATWQQCMNFIFREYIGHFMHVYIDDVFIYSQTIEEHREHIRLVTSKLQEFKFYLKPEKCELFASEIECLGYKIDDSGLHCDEGKLDRIRNWRTPQTYNDIQKFLGLVNYLAQFFPNLAVDAGPLQAIQKNGQSFEWCPIHDICFENIKALASKTVTLKPIDIHSPEPIWLICDASLSDVGAMYGQGPSWQECRPAGFMSKKFTSAQQNYRVFEQETLAILEALLKWEDKLVGRRIHVVTDYHALEFFLSQRRLSHRQARWMEFFARFDFDIRYIKGIFNKIADAFSRYFESDTPLDIHPPSSYVRVDAALDPDQDDLSAERAQEIVNEVLDNAYKSYLVRERMESKRLQEEELHALKDIIKPRDIEAAELAQHAEPDIPLVPSDGPDPTIAHSRSRGKPLNITVEGSDKFFEDVKSGYENDALFKKVLAQPDDYPLFCIKDGFCCVRISLVKLSSASPKANFLKMVFLSVAWFLTVPT